MKEVSGRLDRHAPGLGTTDRQAVSTQLELKRVTKRSPTRYADHDPWRETHFQKADRHGIIPCDVGDTDGRTDANAIEARQTAPLGMRLAHRDRRAENRSHLCCKCRTA